MRNKTEYRQNVQKSVSMIYEINHIWTSEMKWKWRNDRRSERNLWSHWLHSSVGRASHRYREVTGSNPVEVLNFFFLQASLRNCINCVHWTIIYSFSKISFIYRKTTERASKQPVFNLLLDLMVSWQLSKKGIYWTVSDECNARSCVQLTEVRFFFIKFSVDQILVFAGSRTFKRSSVYFLKLLHKDISSKIPWELRFWPWLNLYIRSVLCMMGIFWDYGPTNSVGVW